MLTRQLGYRNNYVLQGGLHYWVETIMNPTPPEPTSPSEEMAKYDFRKGAGMALGGGAAVEASGHWIFCGFFLNFMETPTDHGPKNQRNLQ